MRLLRYLIINVLIVAGIYFGLYLEIEGAKNVLIVSLWSLFLISLFIMDDDVRDRVFSEENLVPQSIGVTKDLILSASLAWFGEFALAFAWLGILLITLSARQSYNQKQKEEL